MLDEVKAARLRGGDELLRLAVHQAEGRAQRLVAGDDAVQRAAQGVAVQRAAQPDAPAAVQPFRLCAWTVKVARPRLGTVVARACWAPGTAASMSSRVIGGRPVVSSAEMMRMAGRVALHRLDVRLDDAADLDRRHAGTVGHGLEHRLQGLDIGPSVAVQLIAGQVADLQSQLDRSERFGTQIRP